MIQNTIGIDIGHSVPGQTGYGAWVDWDAWQPGDLVFYYGNISHVGLYAGNGQIVHAPRPGKSVEYASVDSMPFAGARRPG